MTAVFWDTIENEGDPEPAGPVWKVLIVDDDEDVHKTTDVVLRRRKILDRGIELQFAKSGQEAVEAVARDPDIAVILLDVVMETETAGLDIIHKLRVDLGRKLLRIILRTGQPGYAPELDVIRRYDINDYHNKSELTMTRLVTSLTAAIRSYNQLSEIEEANKSLTALSQALEEKNQEMIHLNRKLADQLTISDAANKAKSDFLAVISHELRTPLNGILGFSQMLKMEVFGPLGNENYKTYVRKILGSGSHLLGMFENIFEFAQFEHASRDLTVKEVDVADPIRDAINVLENEWDERDVTVSLDVAPETPHIRSDRQAIKRAVENVLSNAIKFSQEGGTVAVSLSPASEEDGVLIAIHDDGTGISGTEKEALNKPFEQNESPHMASTGGLGLGIPVTRSLLRDLGGRLVIEGRDGQGTCSCVTLPSEPPAHPRIDDQSGWTLGF